MRPWLLLALLLPTAAAAPFEADLASVAGFAVEGRLEATGDHALLDVAAACEAVRIQAQRLEAVVVTRERTRAGAGPLSLWTGEPTVRRETAAWDDADVRVVACRPDARAYLLAEGAATFALRTPASGPVTLLDAPRAAWVGAPLPGDDSFFVEMPAGSALLDAGIGALVEARGAWRSAMWEVDLRVSGRDGEETLFSGVRREPLATAGAPGGERVEEVSVLLRFQDARLALTDAPATLVGPSLALATEGAVTAREATGHVRVGGTRTSVDAEDVRIEGTGTWTGAPSRSFLRGAPSAFAAEGDASRVSIAGIVVHRPMPLEPETARDLALAAALAGALLLLLKHSSLAAFYTRLRSSTLLDNPNRGRLYREAQSRPGVTIAELARLCDLAEVVVRHHVRMLEKHQMVKVEERGRSRHVFARGAAEPRATAAHIALRDETRRRIAVAIVGAPLGASQKDLVVSTGIPQRVVSYHLAKLEEDQLVRAEGSMPRRYHAATALAQHVQAHAPAAAAV